MAVMAAAVREEDARRYVRANHEFHFVIYTAAGSETLLSIIEALWPRRLALSFAPNTDCRGGDLFPVVSLTSPNIGHG